MVPVVGKLGTQGIGIWRVATASDNTNNLNPSHTSVGMSRNAFGMKIPTAFVDIRSAF